MKKLTTNQLVGQEGVAKFEARVLAAGLSLHRTGPLDAGIDGFIELRDPGTGEVKAQYIAAQIKTVTTLAEDNGERFSYYASERDLNYWFNSTAPVILVVVQRGTDLVFWKSIQGYFQDPERKRSKKVVFVRREDELDETAVVRFAALVASFARPGVVLPSMRIEEDLDTNLLKASYPYRLNIADTDMSAAEIRRAMLRERDHPPIDWVVHSGRILTFRDLGDPPFEEACDQGSIDQIETLDWAESEGEVTKRVFVHLLGRCLSERVREPLSFWRSKKYYYFKRNRRKHGPRIYIYQSGSRSVPRSVVTEHGRRQDGTGPSYYRHAAFFPRFLQIGSEWYLAVEPTYHFTRDGFDEYAFASDRLTTIKQYETNSNVRGHVRMWRAVLTEEGDMLRHEYPFLSFEPVESLRHPYGVADELWMNREDPEMRKARAAGQREFDL